MGSRSTVTADCNLKEHFCEIEALREALPPEIYLWVNAFKRSPNYYEPDQVDRLLAVDPLFYLNQNYHNSRGRVCAAGETSFTVDGEGAMRRCYFSGGVIGNIYAEGFQNALQTRACPEAHCGCYIGYVHLKHLKLSQVYGEGLLERIPDRMRWLEGEPSEV